MAGIAKKGAKKLAGLLGKKRIAWIVVAIVAGVAVWGSGDGRSTAKPSAEPPNPSLIRMPLGEARQAVVVTTSNWHRAEARLARFERRDDGTWKRVGSVADAQLGQDGFNPTVRSRDGRTPIGAVRLVSAFGMNPKSPTKLPYHSLQLHDCWIADPRSPSFNRWVNVEGCKDPNVSLFNVASGRENRAIVTDYNLAQSASAGSAFFLTRRTADSNGEPSSVDGSVRVADHDLDTLLGWLDPAKDPVMITGPLDWLLGRVTTSPIGLTDADAWTQLKIGSKGDAVRAVQQFLNAHGLPTEVDGVFGAQTARQVKAFQRQRGLTVDGIVGRKTAAAMDLIDE